MDSDLRPDVAAEALSWRRTALLFALGLGLALAFSSSMDLAAGFFGTTLPARCALAGALFLCARVGGRVGLRRANAGLPLLIAGLFLAVSPWLVPLATPMGAVPPLAGWPSLVFVARIFFSLPFLAIPGFCAGLALETTLSAGSGSRGWRMGALDFAVLLAGAALGTALGAFQILPWLGAWAVAVAAGLALFLAAVLAGMTAIAPGEASSPAARESGYAPGLLWGFATFGMLLAWERALASVYGPFIDLFPRTLILFLAGAALGCLLLALWPYAQPSPLRKPVLMLLAGCAVALGLTFLNEVPMLFLSAVAAAPQESASFALRLWAIGGVVVMPAAVAMGALLPTLVFGGVDTPHPAPAASWVSSVGGGLLLAAPVVAFWGLPALGFQGLLCLMAGLLLAFAALEFARAGGVSPWRRAPGILLCLLATLGMAWGLPRGNPRLLASGVYLYWPEILDTYKDPHLYREKRLKSDMPFYREGAESTVSVESALADPSTILAITMDGVVTATSYYDLVPQILSAEIPMLMRPGAKSVLLAGYGSGIPASSLLAHPIRSLDVCEPEPAVLEAARRFEPANGNPRSDARLHLHVEDARQVLMAKPRASFGVIVSRPSAPETAAGRTLLTRNFYSLAASRLEPGGLFAQVVSLQGLDEAEVASILKTMQSSFHDVVVLQTYYFELLMLGSDRTITFDGEGMAKAMENEKVRTDLVRIGLADPDALIVRFRLAGRGAEIFARSGRILSDDGPPPTWSGYRSGGHNAPPATLESMDRTSTGLSTRLASLPPGKQGDEQLHRLAQAALETRDAIRAADLGETLVARGDASRGHQVLGDACAIQREQLKAVQEWHLALQADPKNADALISLSDFNSDRGNYSEADAYLTQALAIRPGDPAALYARGRVRYLLKRYKESEADLAQALAQKGDTGAPLALYYLGLIQKEKGNLDGAAEFLRRYLQWGYQQGKLTAVEADVHLTLADVYRGLQLPDLADQQRKAGEMLKDRLAESAKSQRKAFIDFLKKP